MVYVNTKVNVANIAFFLKSHENAVTLSTLEIIKMKLKNGTTLTKYGTKINTS